MTLIKQINLLPCPFCGSNNIGFDWVETYSTDSSYGVFGCRDCEVRFKTDGRGDTEADSAKWNARVNCVDTSSQSMHIAIQSALSISDLWLPGDDVAEEHYEEAKALHLMHREFQRVLSLPESRQPKPSSRPVMPDDNEPITKEWLAEVCYLEIDSNNFGFESDKFWFEIEFDESGKFVCFMAGNEIVEERIKTRGDVRDVCWLIGCEWFDECWGEP